MKVKYRVWQLKYKCVGCGKEHMRVWGKPDGVKLYGLCCASKLSLLVEKELVREPTWEQVVACYGEGY